MKRDTIQRVASPTAILVGLADPLATTCAEALASGGLRVLRVGHVAAACERIPVVMPQLVVVPVDLSAQEGEMLEDRCVAVGAKVLRLAADDAQGLGAILRDAATDAFIRSLRGG